MSKFIIYQHINKENNKRYIGQTSQDPERRWRTNGEGYSDSPKFYEAIKKYGWDGFEHKIIEEGDSQEWANEREIYWIAYYDTFNNDDKGYNMTPGGGNYMKELWKDPIFREKMCKTFSESRKRSWSNEEFAQARLKSLLDGLHKVWNDPEWRAKRIENLMRDKNPNSKKVVNIETNKIFNTIKEASQWAGLNSVSGIGQCCKGKQKTAGKHPDTNEPLHWKYIDDERSNEEILLKSINLIYKPVKCLNNNQIFKSMSEAARWCSLNDTGKSIKQCCIGKQRTAGISPETGEKLRWSFVKGGD